MVRFGTARRAGTAWPSSHEAQSRCVVSAGGARRLQDIVSQGWTDALRALNPDERIYTIWDYVRNAWVRDAGLRIDHLLLSPAVAHWLVAAGIDREVHGWEGE